jgi:hypothetical protein
MKKKKKKKENKLFQISFPFLSFERKKKKN